MVLIHTQLETETELTDYMYSLHLYVKNLSNNQKSKASFLCYSYVCKYPTSLGNIDGILLETIVMHKKVLCLNFEYSV